VNEECINADKVQLNHYVYSNVDSMQSCMRCFILINLIHASEFFHTFSIREVIGEECFEEQVITSYRDSVV